MKKKKLSDLNLEKCIYMCVGPHVKEGSIENEPFESIISRKAKETDKEIGCGWSLWADARIPNIKFNEFFNRNDEVYALMSNHGKEVKSEGEVAEYYLENSGNNREIKKIPDEIYVTYSKNPYALCVEEYYEVDEKDNQFYKNSYDRYCFCNGFELLKKNIQKEKTNFYNICYIAKLKYPFYVKIAKEKDKLK